MRILHWGNRICALLYTLTGVLTLWLMGQQTDELAKMFCLGYTVTCLLGTVMFFRLTALSDRAMRGEISREVADSPQPWVVPERWPTTLMVDNALVDLEMLERQRQMAERYRNQMP